jgi:hypothetical protein
MTPALVGSRVFVWKFANGTPGVSGPCTVHAVDGLWMMVETDEGEWAWISPLSTPRIQPIEGRSPLEAGLREIRKAEAVSDYNDALIRNAGVPGKSTGQ